MKNSKKRNTIGLKDNSEKKGMYLALLIAFVIICLQPMGAYAARTKYVLDFRDSHIRAHRGEVTTLLLKKTLKAQYPWVELSNVDLRKVVLIAKSKKGRGSARLRIGQRWTPKYQVDGDPRSFRRYQRYTFDRIHFQLPSANDRGPWQIDLQGNFIVRKVVIVVEDHWQRYEKRRFYYR